MNKILVIEDNTSLRSSICSYLTSKNFEVIAAGDTFIGIQLAHQFKPDLIVCEANMPKINGFTLSKTMKTHKLTANIPIFLIVDSKFLSYCKLRVPSLNCIERENIFTWIDNLIKSGIPSYC